MENFMIKKNLLIYGQLIYALIFLSVSLAVANIPPVAAINHPGFVPVGQTLTLSGLPSNDPDGKINSYLWQQLGGQTIQIGTPQDSVVHINTNLIQGSTELIFRLEVVDDSSALDADTVSVIVFSEVSIGEARVAGIDSVVAFRCLVTATEMGLPYFMQDLSAGMAINDGTVNGQLNPGDSVFVIGRLTQVGGLIQIDHIDSVSVQNTGNSLPEPLPIMVAGLNSGQYESRLVIIDSLNFTSGVWPAAGEERVLQLADTSGDVSLWLKPATDIDGSSEPNWPLISLTGIATVSDSILICPRNRNDLVGSAPAIYSPVRALRVRTVPEGALVRWKTGRPDVKLTYNDGNPGAIWELSSEVNMGVVFDLSAYPGATLEQVNFLHFGRGMFSGTAWFNLYIVDWSAMQLIRRMDSLSVDVEANNAVTSQGFEIGSIDPAVDSIAICIQPLTIAGGKYFPSVLTDLSELVVGVNYLMRFEPLEPVWEFYEYELASGEEPSNININLWIDLNDGNPGDLVKLEPGLPQPSSNPVTGFKIFRGSALVPAAEIGVAPAEALSFTDTEIFNNPGNFNYAVTAVYDDVFSDTVFTSYSHPFFRSLYDTRMDNDFNGVPDLLGETVSVSGVVISPSLSDSLEFFLQDGYSGLSINTENFSFPVNIGDSLFMIGQVGQDSGMTTLEPLSRDDFFFLKGGSEIDTILGDSSVLSEENESMLVFLDDLHLLSDPWPADSLDGFVRVADQTDTLTLFIDRQTGLDGWTPPAGSFNLTAIVIQQTSQDSLLQNYYLLPRLISDFSPLTGIPGETENLPLAFSLAQNYPNPFNPSTKIVFTVPQEEKVKLLVYNLLGQKVHTAVDENLKAGKYEVVINASGLASGLYFYSLQAGDYSAVKKMILVR